MKNPNIEGLLLVNKEAGCTSFQIISQLRRKTGIKTIGHAGTLDPFATGVMVVLIGRNFTKKSNDFLANDKEYLATLELGKTTDTFDLDGNITETSSIVPTFDDVQNVIKNFQGQIEQIPPMFSAKKINGKKLCDLAREGKTVERQPVNLTVSTKLISYEYPYIKIQVSCSKGTYIRSIGHDMGQKLKCGAHLVSLTRTRSGKFLLSECLDQKNIKDPLFDISPYLKQTGF